MSGANEQSNASIRREIVKLNGHSGCVVTLMQEGEKVFVKKISSSPSYNSRLQKQMRLQEIAAKTKDVPKIYSCGMIGSLFYFDMQYIPGVTLAESLEDMNSTTIKNVMYALITNLNPSLPEVNCGGAFIQKIESLERCLPDIRPFRAAISSLKRTLVNISGSGVGHGDLTLENVLLDANRRIYYIDFMDSFYHSWKMDCAKLLQDLELQWAWRYHSINVNLLNNINCARQILLNYLNDTYSKQTIAEIYDLLLLNILRIVPYCKKDSDLQWCLKSINTMLEDKTRS